MSKRKNVIIIGAAGRDFHNFNILFRDSMEFRVVAFTAAQIPYIENRNYPKELSGRLYRNGIRIYGEERLPELIDELHADICVMSYSDLSYQEVMKKGSICNSKGADFALIAPEHTMLKSRKPVIAICAVRTGSGKTQTTKYVSLLLRRLGIKPVIIRHPMPYGVLKDEILERFETLEDLDRYKATIEEKEDYEPHIKNGFVVYAGVDYEKILSAAEKEADVVIFDGGNNDAPFIKPDLLITVADPLREGNELSYYPGETVARMADILLINKVNSATKEQVARVRRNLRSINGRAKIIKAESVIKVDDASLIKGRSAGIVEDGPSITHGGMKFGAATVAANLYGARKIVDAKEYAVGEIKKTFEKYPHLKNALPAIGYSEKQIKDLGETINRIKADIVISATPTDLGRLIKINKPLIQVYYDLRPIGNDLDSAIRDFVSKKVRNR